MTFLTQKKFDFVSHALPQDTFGVVRFEGVEGLSMCYRFEIMLVASDPEIDLASVLEHPAIFTILRDEGDIPFHGIISEFEQLHAMDEYVFYRAILSPKLWWLSLTHHNQIFLGEPHDEDNTIPIILEAVFKDGGLTSDDFDLTKLMAEYPHWEYVCQYGESHLNFLSRWMEREGMYYYFEQDTNAEKVIVTDTNLSHLEMTEGKTMYYSPPSGLTEPFREEVIHAFTCKQTLLPGKLHVKDYNYRTPSLDLTAQAEVTDRGRGEVHIYGEHFRTLQEGNTLAGIRAQVLLSRQKRFRGESTIPYLRPGYQFGLEDHYREDFNQKYLTIELTHAGSQAAYLTAGVQRGLSEVEERPYYRNSFVAIPADVQYRHPQETQKPVFSGTINARVDAEGSGEFAELDEQGRYKIKLPFDLSGRPGGKASHWLRMAQPYAGENQGMHFPLHKNTEVLLTFIEGDPDRPIIAAAVPNPETPSPITGANNSRSIIQTGPGPETGSAGAEYARTTAPGVIRNNYIEFEDKKPEYIKIHSPHKVETFAGGKYKRRELGPSEESGHDRIKYDGTVFSDKKKKRDKAISWADGETDKLYDKFFQFAPSNVHGYDEKTELNKSNDSPPTGFPEEYIEAPIPDPASDFTTYLESAESSTAKTTGPSDNESEESLEDLVTETGAWEDYWRYWVVQNHQNAKGYEGVKYYYPEPQTPGSDDYKEISEPWYLTYMPPTQANITAWDSHCQTKWNDWVAEKTADWKKWQPHVVRGHVRVSHRDTFNMQEGHIYDFGGYWVYNLGNCYIENYMCQNPELNSQPGTYDMLDVGGPNWAAWKTVGASNSKNELKDTGDENKYGKWAPGDVWVEKRINGSSYAYNHKAHSIEINEKCSTHNINISGRHIEEKYSGTGKRTLHSVSESGKKEENKYDRYSGNRYFYGKSWKEQVGSSANVYTNTTKWNRHSQNKVSKSQITESQNSIHSLVWKYDRRHGGLASYSDTTDTGGQISNFKFSATNKSHAVVSISGEDYFKFTFGGKIGMAFDLANVLSLHGKFSFNDKINLAVNTGILNFDWSSYLGLKVGISTCIAGKLDVDMLAGIKVKHSGGYGIGIESDELQVKIKHRSPGKWELSCAGFEATKHDSLKAAFGNIDFKQFSLKMLL